MAEEIVTNITVNYDIRGIDNTIRGSQRLLYFMNAIRLSITDFQRLLKDPSIENLFWTGIQLTQVYTNLIRLIRQANRAAAGGTAMTLLGGGGGGGRMTGRAITGVGVGQLVWGTNGMPVAAKQSLISTIMGYGGMVMAIPGFGFVAGATIMAGVVVGNRYILEQQHLSWQQRQREFARNQGLEY